MISLVTLGITSASGGEGIDSFAVVLTGMLALSIFERTREFGLLRAVGTARRQVRRR